MFMEGFAYGTVDFWPEFGTSIKKIISKAIERIDSE